MGTTSTFFGGGGGSSGAAQPVYTSFNARKKLTHKATTTGISGNNGYLGVIFLCPINDTHFIVHYKNTNQNLAYAKMFELNTSTFSVSPIAPSSNWLSIGSSGSTGDMDGIAAGNGDDTAFLAYSVSSNSRIFKVVWDGSTGLSQTTVINRTGAATPWNNASCTIDGTLIAQIFDQNSVGYHYSISPTGTSTSGNNTISIENTASKGGSVGMDNGIFSVGMAGSSDPRLFRLYKGNNMSWNITDADIKHNNGYAYNPNHAKIVRSGNRVVYVFAQSSTNGLYGKSAIEGYCGETQPDGGTYHRVYSTGGTTNSNGFMDQNYKSKPHQQVEFGSFNRQYDGTYLDRGFIADFGEDTRFSVSYPYQYLYRMGTTGSHANADRQCRIGNYIIQAHRLGSSGNYTMEFDVWELT